jgi:predicted phosphohydrolase
LLPPSIVFPCRITPKGFSMARVFALADLHLSLAGTKPMDVFGELWRDHPRRMAAAWDQCVGPADTVLLPGDFSWARSLEEAQPDMDWLAQRPGRKLLLRGNHDSWWGSRAKVRRALPGGCEPLHNNAIELGHWILVGARGWILPGDPLSTEQDEKVFRRELGRLEASLADADGRFGRDRPRIAMLHYPPRLLGGPAGPVIERLREGGVSVCVYGHLHGEDHRLAVRGECEGLRFHFVAADAVDFAPQLIPLPRKVGESS